MHALAIVQQLIRTWCPQIHAARLSVILAAVAAAVRRRRLTLTEVGRALISGARVKHNIKRIDRLLGNRHFAAELFALYQALARGLQLHYQSNTRRTRPVLSLFNLACLLVRRAADQLLACDLPHLQLPIRPPLPLRNAL
jgi:hypothetical protein